MQDSLSMSRLFADGQNPPDAGQFGIYVPDGVAGQPVQVVAPDGVTLEINMPDNVVAGDMISFQKLPDGTWAPELISASMNNTMESQPPMYDAHAVQSGDLAQALDAVVGQAAMMNTEEEIPAEGPMGLLVQRVLTMEQRIEEVASGSSEDAHALAKHQEEHQVRYVEEQDAMLTRLESVEQFLQQMAPALQGLLTRFEDEQGRQGDKVSELLEGVRNEWSKQAEVMEARLQQQEEDQARLEAAWRRQEAEAAAHGLLAGAAQSKNDANAASAEDLDRLMRLVESQNAKTTEFDEQLASLVERAKQLEARSDASVAAATASKDLDAALSKAVQSQGAKHAEFESQLLSVGQQLVSLAARASTLEARSDAVSAAAAAPKDPDAQQQTIELEDSAAIIARIQRLESAAVGAGVEAGAEVVAVRAAEEVVAVAARVEAIELLMQTLVSSGEARTEEAIALKEGSAALAYRLNDLEQLSSSLAAALNEAPVAALATRIDSLEQLSSSLANECRSLASALNDVPAAAFAERIDSLEQLSSMLAATLKEAPTAALAVRVDALEQQNPAAAFAARLDALEKQGPAALSAAFGASEQLTSRMEAIEAVMKGSDLGRIRREHPLMSARIESLEAFLGKDWKALLARLDGIEASIASQPTRAAAPTGPATGKLSDTLRHVQAGKLSDTLGRIPEANLMDTLGQVIPHKVRKAVQLAVSDRKVAEAIGPNEVLMEHSVLLKNLAAPAVGRAPKRSSTPPPVGTPVPPPRFVPPSISIEMPPAPPVSGPDLPADRGTPTRQRTPAHTARERSVTPTRNNKPNTPRTSTLTAAALAARQRSVTPTRTPPGGSSPRTLARDLSGFSGSGRPQEGYISRQPPRCEPLFADAPMAAAQPRGQLLSGTSAATPSGQSMRSNPGTNSQPFASEPPLVAGGGSLKPRAVAAEPLFAAAPSPVGQARQGSGSSHAGSWTGQPPVPRR